MTVLCFLNNLLGTDLFMILNGCFIGLGVIVTSVVCITEFNTCL